jgi:hypothetical protein
MQKRTFLTTPEAAAILRIRPSTLEVWRCYGKGPAYLKFGRSVRYDQKTLEAWIDGQGRGGQDGRGCAQ